MRIKALDHVAIVVDDLTAATEFFVQLGLDLLVDEPVKGRWVDGRVEGRWFEGSTADSIVGLDGVRVELVHLQAPDGGTKVELTKYHAPPAHGEESRTPANTPGLRHICFDVGDIDAMVAGLRSHGTEFVGEFVRGQDSRLCYVRGPEGIIIELAEDLD